MLVDASGQQVSDPYWLSGSAVTLNMAGSGQHALDLVSEGAWPGPHLSATMAHIPSTMFCVWGKAHYFCRKGQPGSP